MVQFGDMYKFAKYKLQVLIFTRDLDDYTKFVLAGYIKINNVKNVTNNKFSIILFSGFLLTRSVYIISSLISLYNLIHLTVP